MKRLYLGIDLGTGSAKGVVVTAGGKIVARAEAPARTSSPEPGFVEMDAEADWWGTAASLSRSLVAQVGRDRIAGVAISGLGPALVVTGDDGLPLRPAILYGIDRRARRQIKSFNAELGASAILARGGSDLSAQALGPKLAWIRDEEPEIWSRTRRWFSSHSYVVHKLTGQWVLDHHTASQCDPLYDIREQTWSADWVERLIPGLPLPQLSWPHEVVGAVTREAAAATGLRAGTPVVAGTVDAWAEALSAGVQRPGDLMLMYGSTMFLVQVLPAATTAHGFWTTSGIVPGSHTLAAGMATSGSFLSWVQALTGGADYGRLLDEAARVPPGSRGLIALPYLEGERSPIYDPDARGAFLGLTLAHGAPELFRAAHEAVAFGLRQILDSLDEVTGPPARIVAVGGGARSRLWPQIVSDVTQRRQEIPRTIIGASYGDALLAAMGTGEVPIGTDWSDTDATIEPDPYHAGVYDDLYSIYSDLYPKLRGEMHDLAYIQRREPAVVSHS